jgi:sensor histidine kinase YesM
MPARHLNPPLGLSSTLRPFAHGRHWRALLFALGWLGFAGLFSAQSISSYGGPAPTPVARTLAFHALEASYWALASLFLHRAAGHMRSATATLAACILMGTVTITTLGSIVWIVLVTWVVGSQQWPFALWEQVLESAHSSFAYGVLLALMLTAASTAVHLADEARDRALRQAHAEAALVRERLEMLTLHLQPHFLFNTLNTIVGLVPSQPLLAVDIVHRLSALLRAAIQHAGSVLVPLEEELRLVDQYVGIARARHGARLTIDRVVPPGLIGARVPPMLLQPLLENAIQHTVERRSGPGLVRLSILRSDTGLDFIVEDDGVGLPAEPVRSAAAGVGLSTTRARLAALFGDRASLTLTSGQAGGARAVIRIPHAACGFEGELP